MNSEGNRKSLAPCLLWEGEFQRRRQGEGRLAQSTFLLDPSWNPPLGSARLSPCSAPPVPGLSNIPTHPPLPGPWAPNPMGHMTEEATVLSVVKKRVNYNFALLGG